MKYAIILIAGAGAGLVASVMHAASPPDSDGHDGPLFPDEPAPLTLENVPERPRPLLELGPKFLAPGGIGGGFTLPTGAVWQPELLVFGTYRSALQSFDNGESTVTEWVNNLDIFANLQLSGTERILFGMRPLEDGGQFVGYAFHPEDEWTDDFSDRVTSLYFEGDFGEIFPGLDPADRYSLDWGFSVGRQPIFFQEGMLINDTLDALGVTRNTVLFDGGSDWRSTFLWAWNDIERDDNRTDADTGEAHLFGMFNEIDIPLSTINADVAWVNDTEGEADGLFFGLSAVQRLGTTNTAFRILNSVALDEESEAVSDGTLLFGEVSWTPHFTHDIVYLNGFIGIDEFSSAARDPLAGGPLGRVGLLYEAVGIGRYGPPLSNRPAQAYGVAAGYQMFLDGTRRQITFEVGARNDTDDSDTGAAAAGVSFQQAIGRRTILRSDAFAAAHEVGRPSWGFRLEVLIKF